MKKLKKKRKKKKRKSQQRDDYDSPWKDIIEAYFREFMEFFFPEAADGIDWTKGYNFLDKELQKVVRDAKLGRRLADKLAQVWQKDGKEAWVLVHVEVQGQDESDFNKRMFVYNYRIFDRYEKKVASLAILADENPKWKPDHYWNELWGCKVGIEFPVVKLPDYADKWDELEKSDNPFALAVMAHLKTQETRKDHNERRRWKICLVRKLYERGYKKQDIISLFHFTDWIMRLPEKLDEDFWQEVSQYEEKEKMPY
ncbi:MAG: cytosolic protein, partial [Desulfobacteraceae bacterium]|nr:cytosolic protein [Desulfobacteraceae bacterium]